MMGKGERGVGGGEGWGGGQPSIFLLMTIADSPLLGRSASGQSFYDDSGRSPLADLKPLFRNFSLH